jgi:hypothetical protein
MSKVWKRRDRDVWVADYRDSRGRRVRLSAKTREQAENLLAEKIKESRQAQPVSRLDADITLKDYVLEFWLENAKQVLENATYSSYEQNLRIHVLPVLGHYRIRDLHTAHIKNLLKRKRRDGYSKNSVRLMKAALSSVLSDAVDEDYVIANNPAIFSTGNKKKKTAYKISKTDTTENIRPMSQKQAEIFMHEAAKDPRYGMFFIYGVKTWLDL